MKLLITIGAIDNVEFTATLEHISPKGEEKDGAIQFPIKANVDLIDTIFIRAGYSATASIVIDKREAVMAINEAMLQFGKENKDAPYVEVETAPQKFEKKYIEVGLSDGINIEAISGLKMEDRIKVPKQ